MRTLRGRKVLEEEQVPGGGGSAVQKPRHNSSRGATCWLPFRTLRPQGREHLRRLLNWEEFNEQTDSRRSILLDTLYESIIFAVGKGFPWVEVAQVVKFTEELLRETKGCSVTEAVMILGNKLRDYKGHFNTTRLLALCDYFHHTFIHHYKLYQYVLGQEQQVDLTVAHLEVCVPPQPLPLAEGMDRDLWTHKQQVAALTEAEAQKRTDMLLLKEALLLEKKNSLQKAFTSAMPAQPSRVLERQELESLVRQAVHIQMAFLQELLQCQIQNTFAILDLKLQKKTLNLNTPAPFPPPITSHAGQEEALKPHKVSKGKKAKARK
ncbi:uncharacterized protein C8orf74 homolog isoform X1 [Callithrix jacchus]|uniref:Chromosome 8 open reading frame 74 n=1 Tax=Callithrix jacchus TaxID=9483 RepID=A0A8I3WVN1_CALJA|nr:uncharacterized protein C8orf74 homolog isoform X1 [Callithrix jacchus]